MLMDRVNGGRVAAGGFIMLAALAACGSRGGEPPGIANAAIAPDQPPTAIAEAPAVRPAAAEVRAVETAGLLPPRSQVVPAAPIEGAIAFAYRTPDAPAAVARWYRGPQGQSGFRLLSEMDEGGEHVLTGTTARPAGDFSVRLAAANGGGTTAMVLVTARR